MTEVHGGSGAMPGDQELYWQLSGVMLAEIAGLAKAYTTYGYDKVYDAHASTGLPNKMTGSQPGRTPLRAAGR